MDCFTILGLSRNATKDEVRKAYYELARKYHPDKAQTNSGERMKMINAAYEEALRKVDNKYGHMAYANLSSSREAPKSGHGAYKTAQPSYTTKKTTTSGYDTYKTTMPGYDAYQTGKSGHATYKTAQPGYTTYKTTKSGYGGYKDSEPSYTTYHTTGSKASSSAYGSSRARDDIRFSEFGESRLKYQEFSRGSRRAGSDLPEWVIRQGKVKKMAVEEAEQAMRYGGGDMDTLARNLKRARNALESHEEWVEEGLEYGYDFHQFGRA